MPVSYKWSPASRCSISVLIGVRSDTFTVAAVDKTLSGYQPCQLGKNYRSYRDPDDGDINGP